MNFQRFFLSHIKKILSFPFKLKYLNKKRFLSYIEKTQPFLVNIEYILTTCFQSHMERLKTYSSIYIVNFDKNW